MQLKKISLENFKCFRKLDMDLGKITLLTGANSSGKSSLIYAILGMMQTEGFPFYFSPNGKYVNMGSFEDLSWNHEKENIIKIGLIVKEEDNDNPNNYGNIYIDIFLRKDVRNIPYITLLTAKNNSFDISVKPHDSQNHEVTINKENGLYKASTKKGHLSSGNFIFFKIDNGKLKVSSKLSNRDIIKGFNKINYLSSHRQPTQRLNFQQSKSEYTVNMYGENYDLQILDWKENHPELLKELVKHIKAIRLFENIKIKRKSGGTFELLVKNHAKSVYQNLYDVGTGVSHFLPIMVADLQLPQNSTLIVSDPELHLHPSVQANFGTYLVNQVRDNQKNYIIETHSEYLLNRLRLEIVKGNISPEDVKVYYLQNNGTESECFSIDLLKNGQIQGAPAAFFDTYMKDNMEIALNSFA